MNKVLGIVNLHDSPSLGVLTARRPLGVTSFLGRYGLMDFTLSNYSNSGIDRVIVLAEREAHSVRSHLGDGQVWVRNTKLGFQRIYKNESLLPSSKFNTDIANLKSNSNTIGEIPFEYVVIAPSFFIMSYDYNELIQSHIESGADVTVLTKRVPGSNKDFLNADVAEVEEEGKVSRFFTNTGRRKEVDISLESFVFTRSAFERMIKESGEVSLLYSIRRMVAYYAENHLMDVRALPFDGYVVPILSLNLYVKHSFDLLQYSSRLKIFKDEWPIYTTTHNTPPALYGERAIVSNSFIANGSIIKGRVKNSIISRDVIVEEGAVVEDSIIFTQTEIGKDIKLRYVLADKHVKFVEQKKVNGEKDEILYIEQGVRV
ncbi:MAG: glucose-1-phosphate adenylyltransferase subunit GlgD [Bacilli bacterium]|nr:glucose-1-phosphate adenylyltransferase subunit GlgD [Bacilli bacterium]